MLITAQREAFNEQSQHPRKSQVLHSIQIGFFFFLCRITWGLLSPPHMQTGKKMMCMRRFVGHEKACYPQKRRRGHARHRHNGTDASPWRRKENRIHRIQTLTSSVFQSAYFSRCAGFRAPTLIYGFLGVTQPICGELVHNMASWVCAPRYLRAGCCCWRLAALQVM